MMVKSWKEEGRAFSHVDNDDSEFFELIKKTPTDVGVTSQVGNDLVYYDTTLYASDADALKSRKL